jgi:hypothetical protein
MSAFNLSGNQISFLVISAGHIGCSIKIAHDHAEIDSKNILKVERIEYDRLRYDKRQVTRLMTWGLELQ